MTIPVSLIIPCVLVGISEICLNITRRSKPGALSRDRNSLSLIWLLNLLGIGLAVFFVSGLPRWVFPFKDQIYVPGICFIVAGMALRWYAIIELGRFFTTNVAIAADHRLIESGPYYLIRHPSYSGTLLFILGFGLCMGNIASLLALMICFLIPLVRRIQVEEMALKEAFGDQYQAYAKRTKRLIPFIF